MGNTSSQNPIPETPESEAAFDRLAVNLHTKIKEIESRASTKSQYITRYDNILADDNMKQVVSLLDEVGKKYRFTCNLLLENMPSNYTYPLYKWREPDSNPIRVEVLDDDFAFLKETVFDNTESLKKRIYKQVIKMLAGGNIENTSLGPNDELLIRCRKCGETSSYVWLGPRIPCCTDLLDQEYRLYVKFSNFRIYADRIVSGHSGGSFSIETTYARIINGNTTISIP